MELQLLAAAILERFIGSEAYDLVFGGAAGDGDLAPQVADDDVADKIAKALEAKLGRSVDLKQEVDDELIGGALIRAEDMVIDGSVRTRLQKLAESLVS